MAVLTTLPEVLAFSIFLLLAWTAVDVYVIKYGPIAAARSLTKVHNWFYAAVSLVMLVQILNNDDTQDSFTIRYIFHLSKFYESLDILLVCASGSQISGPLAFHHFTTPYLTYLRYARHHGGWRPFAALNNLHHLLVYTFFARGKGASVLLRSVLPCTGILQLIVSVWVDVMYGLDKYYDEGGSEPWWPNLGALALVGGYFVLFFQGFGFRVGQKMVLFGGVLGVFVILRALIERGQSIAA